MPQHEQDIFWMREALKEAQLAAELGEVPVGAVVCRNGELVASAGNRRETHKSALAHAELLAIAEACEKLGGWRLHECTLYVTLEPCPMCTGAIINARIKRVVYGAPDPKAGCLGSLADFNQIPFNHHPETSGFVLQEECANILKTFFLNLRKKNS